MTSRRPARSILTLAMAVASTASAQWSPDPAANLAIADRSGDQIVPLVASAPDGSTWVAWADGASGNWDVYLQRLDAQGVEQWPHNGLLLSNHPQNSAIFGKWGLIADGAGNAVLVFTDERAGGDLDVYAYKVSPAGQMLWGADGVVVSDNADFEPGARVVEASDGDLVVAWQRSPTGGGDLRIQRLAPADGSPRLAAGGVPVAAVVGESPGFLELVAADGGSVVLSWLRDTTRFTSPRHLRAEKFLADGSSAWGGPVTVYDAFSLPIGYYPQLFPDEAGGAILLWHRSDGAAFSSFVQHLDASGVELFPHLGVEVSTTAGFFHIDPTLAREPTTGEIYVFWNERNLAQSQWGLFAQKLSPAGARQWGNGGIELLPVDTVYKSYPRAVPASGGGMVFLTDAAGTGDRLFGMRVDASGAQPWGGPLVVSSVASVKARYPVTVDGQGVAKLVWEDDRNGNVDLYGQNVNPDGSLGPTLVPICLWRADVIGLSPHSPPRPAIYRTPTPDGISLQGAAYRCPFADGQLEPDGAVLTNGIPLQPYQVSRTVNTLRLVKTGTTIRFHF